VSTALTMTRMASIQPIQITTLCEVFADTIGHCAYYSESGPGSVSEKDNKLDLRVIAREIFTQILDFHHDLPTFYFSGHEHHETIKVIHFFLYESGM